MTRSRTLVLVTAGVLAGALLGPPGVAVAKTAVETVFVGNDDAHPVPTKAIGTTAVSGTVNVGGNVTVGNGSGSPVPVEQAPREVVVLQDPLSGDEVTPDEPALYGFDTSGLSAVRVGFSSLSGTETCHVSVTVGGATVDKWTVGQFEDRGAAYDVPGSDIVVRVDSPNICYALVEVYGLPIP